MMGWRVGGREGKHHNTSVQKFQFKFSFSVLSDKQKRNPGSSKRVPLLFSSPPGREGSRRPGVVCRVGQGSWGEPLRGKVGL